MTGAMYAAISGLKTHMQALNVVGHNVANINTDGYKAGRSVFHTALYTQIRGGSDGSTTAGARNPSQLGYGVSMATVDIDMSTGTYKPTGKPTDCMLDGDGFFLFGDKETAASIDPADPSTFSGLMLSRVGDIDFKSDNYLTNYAGNVLYGFMCIGVDSEGQAVFSDQLVPIRLPKMETTYQDKNGNTVLKGTGAAGSNSDPNKFYAVDQNGTITTTEVKKEDVTTVKTVRYPTAWEITETGTGGTGGTTTRPSLGPAYETGTGGGTGGGNAATPTAVRLHDYNDELPYAQFDTISFDEKTGIISGTTKDSNQYVIIGMMAVGNVANPNGVTQVSDTCYQVGPGSGSLTITTLGNIGEEAGIEYVNGSLFTPPQGSNATQPPEGSRVTSAGTTKLLTSGLEQSKTDLATEIANMITTQRGYQANTRIITVTDSMLEELVNMKR